MAAEPGRGRGVTLCTECEDLLLGGVAPGWGPKGMHRKAAFLVRSLACVRRAAPWRHGSAGAPEGRAPKPVVRLWGKGRQPVLSPN